MAGRKLCSYCGKPVGAGGYCTSCRLHQDFLRKAGNTSLYYYNIGLDRARVHDLTGAMDALKMSLRYNKTNVEARNLLGLIYYEMGETVPALSHWVMSVNYRTSDNPAVKYLKELRDNPKTLEESDELARVFNQALQQAENHEFDLASIQLHKCITGNSHFVKAYLLLALISIETKRNGVAKKYLAHVLSIDRGNATAIHFLREMGETDESLNRLIEQSEESSGELFDYYGMEEEVGKRPARKIAPKEKEKVRVRVRKTREQNMVRYSNLYMFAGIIIGACVFYFLISPGIKKNYNDRINEMERTYNSTLASRNSEIDNLNTRLRSAEEKAAVYDEMESGYKKTIDQQKEEIETLKTAVEAGGGSVVVELPEDQRSDEDTAAVNRTGVGHNIGQVDNAAAERNNANVRGISGSDIELLIQGE